MERRDPNAGGGGHAEPPGARHGAFLHAL
jgi:hypothetical protein